MKLASITAWSIMVETGIAPTMVWGASGIAKSAIALAMGKAYEMPVLRVYPAHQLAEDVNGIPYVERRRSTKDPERWVLRTRRLAPEWYCKVKKYQRCILFLDEFSYAKPSVQSNWQGILGDGEVGHLKLPKETRIIACSNPPGMGSSVDLTPQVANRFWHLDWKYDASAWVSASLQEFPAPKITKVSSDWELRIPHWHRIVTSYVSRKPVDGHNQPNERTAAGKAWPSPRSWENGWKALAAGESFGLDIQTLLLEGFVGASAAGNFFTWLKDLDLPDPEEVLADPQKLEVREPVRFDRILTILEGVVSVVVLNNSRERWRQAWSVLSMAHLKGVEADLIILSARLLEKNRPEGLEVTDLPVELQRVLLKINEAASKRGRTQP